MPDLGRMAQELFRQRPLVPTPDMDAVSARAHAYRQRRQIKLTALAVSSLLVLSAVVLPTIDGNSDDGQQLRVAGNGDPGDGIGLPIDLPPPVDDLVPLGTSSTTSTTEPGPTTTSTTRPGPTTTTTTRPSDPESCPGGQNAGATDVGVTATEVKVLVRIRPGASRAGSQAVINKVNQAGGICARRVAATYVTEGDSVDPAGFFAVLPDDRSGIADGVPVVGGEGLSKSEFQSGWSWPVGTPTAAQSRIIAKHAWDVPGARTFAIVYDSQRAYGTEAKNALSAYVQQLGGQMVVSMGINPGRASYTAESQQLASQCNDKCDAIVYAIDAATARAFISSGGTKGKLITSAMSPLVSTRFAQECGAACDGMVVWSPYVMPIGEYANDPDVAAYRQDVRSVDPAVDIVDQSVAHSYMSAKVLVAALDKAGANLTRARLRTALDAMTYTSGMVTPLRWDGDRVANTALFGMSIRTGQNTFIGFAPAANGLQQDPAPGQFP